MRIVTIYSRYIIAYYRPTVGREAFFFHLFKQEFQNLKESSVGYSGFYQQAEMVAETRRDVGEFRCACRHAECHGILGFLAISWNSGRPERVPTFFDPEVAQGGRGVGGLDPIYYFRPTVSGYYL